VALTFAPSFKSALLKLSGGFRKDQSCARILMKGFRAVSRRPIIRSGNSGFKTTRVRPESIMNAEVP